MADPSVTERSVADPSVTEVTLEVGSGSHDGAGPVRTCVGCRRRGRRSVLLRFVRAEVEGTVVVVHDDARTLPGRGAWLHPDLVCLELARRRSAFARALRVGKQAAVADLPARVVTRAGQAPTAGGCTSEKVEREEQGIVAAPGHDNPRHRPRRGREQPEAGLNADEQPMSNQR